MTRRHSAGCSWLLHLTLLTANWHQHCKSEEPGCLLSIHAWLMAVSWQPGSLAHGRLAHSCRVFCRISLKTVMVPCSFCGRHLTLLCLPGLPLNVCKCLGLIAVPSGGLSGGLASGPLVTSRWLSNARSVFPGVSCSLQSIEMEAVFRKPRDESSFATA